MATRKTKKTLIPWADIEEFLKEEGFDSIEKISSNQRMFTKAVSRVLSKYIMGLKNLSHEKEKKEKEMKDDSTE